MGKYLDSFFDHEVGNKHMKMYKVYSNWSGLTKKSFFKHKECWPMFVVTAVTAVGTFWYLYRLGAQVDSGVNRFDKRVHRMGIQDDISIATFIDHKAVNPQTKMPHLDEYKLDY